MLAASHSGKSPSTQPSSMGKYFLDKLYQLQYSMKASHPSTLHLTPSKSTRCTHAEKLTRSKNQMLATLFLLNPYQVYFYEKHAGVGIPIF